MTQAKAGFTLLELLLVCAIIGILGGVGTLLLRGAIREARLSEGSTQLATNLQRARSNAQRFNQGATLALIGSPATRYTLTLNGQSTTYALPPSVQVTTPTNARTITYSAPFGELSGASNLTLTVELQGQSETRIVRVLGVTGKVYSQ